MDRSTDIARVGQDGGEPLGLRGWERAQCPERHQGCRVSLFVVTAAGALFKTYQVYLKGSTEVYIHVLCKAAHCFL